MNKSFLKKTFLLVEEETYGNCDCRCVEGKMNEPQADKNTDNAGAKGTSVAGKYLTFSLASEKYGVEILKVIEINSMMHITKVPRCAPHVKGVVNLRGKIIPVIDLRALFGMPESEYDEQTCTIMVNVTGHTGEHMAIGMIVDRVLEVADFKDSEIAPAPEYGVNVDSDFIIGMGTREQTGVVILVDINKVLRVEDLRDLSSAGIPQEHELINENE